MMLGEVEDAVWGLVLRAWGFTLNLNIWTIVGAAPFSRAISTTPKTPQLSPKADAYIELTNGSFPK